MAHLTDFEELIARVGDRNMADYMREAMTCYMAGAYRGCIVMSFIALFEDLLAKLGELARINSEARQIHTQAQKLQDEQKVFERYLIRELSRAKLIPELDASTLDTIRERRNMAAHPSGHHPSAEEARFVFFTVIDRFLSKPLLRTTNLVDELAARLANVYFFTSDSIRANAEIVSREIRDLHGDALPLLLNMLSDEVISSNETIATNARRFLLGLAGLRRAEVNEALCRRVIAGKADDAAFSEVVLSLISANGELCLLLDQATHRRVAEALADRTRLASREGNPARLDHPVRVLRAIHDTCGADKLQSWYEDEVVRCLEAFPYISYFGPVLGGLETYRETYVTILQAAAGSSVFEEANAFARAVPELDEPLSALTSEQEALKLILAILNAAEYGAFAARDLKNDRFAAIPRLTRKALDFADAHPERAAALCGDDASLQRLRAYYLAPDQS